MWEMCVHTCTPIMCVVDEELGVHGDIHMYVMYVCACMCRSYKSIMVEDNMESNQVQNEGVSTQIPSVTDLQSCAHTVYA